MRLINIRILKLEEFFGQDIPPYVMLSHWSSDSEISFWDLESQGNIELKEHKDYGVLRPGPRRWVGLYREVTLQSRGPLSVCWCWYSGSFPAASTRVTPLSCQKLLILCFDGTSIRWCAIYIYLMSQVTIHSRIVSGWQEAGRFKSCLRLRW